MAFDACFAKANTTGTNIDHTKAAFEVAYGKILRARPDLSAEMAVNEAVKAINLDALQTLRNETYRRMKNETAFARGVNESSTKLPGAALLKAPEATSNGMLQRMLVSFGDLKGDTESASARSHGLIMKFSGEAASILESMGSKGWGFKEHAENSLKFMKALRGEITDSPEINAAAGRWKELTENLRLRANSAGAIIGKLDDWMHPQSWSRDRVLQQGTGFGRERYNSAKQKFVDALYRHADLAKYAEKGAVTDAQVREYIGHAADTVLTEAASKIDPDEPMGRSTIASRMAKERQLFIATAEGMHELNTLFGGKSLPELLNDHINGITKSIALMERFGPDAQKTIEKLIAHNIAEAPDGVAKLAEESAGERAMQYFEHMAGLNNDVKYTIGGKFIAGLKNLNMLKLGASGIYSITTDQSTARATLAAFGASGWQQSLFQMRTAHGAKTKAQQEFLYKQAGIAAHVVNNAILRDFNDAIARGWTRVVPEVLLKAAHVRQASEWTQEAARATLLSAMGEKVTKYTRLADVKGFDAKILKANGFNEADWKVMRLAEQEDWVASQTVLTHRAINAIPDEHVAAALGIPVTSAAGIKQALGEKLIGFAHEFGDTVVVQPGEKQRAEFAAAGAKYRGTAFGELISSVAQFKAFPFAFMARQARLAQGLGAVGGTGYFASLMAANAVMGMVAGSIQDLLAGREIRDWTTTGNIGVAVSKGGGLGMASDVMTMLASTNTGQVSQSLLQFAAGPTVSAITQLAISLTKPYSHFDDPNYDVGDYAGDLAKQASDYVPGHSLPLVRLITDRLFLNQLQEWSNPGYNLRSQKRVEKAYGAPMWWAPGETVPEFMQ